MDEKGAGLSEGGLPDDAGMEDSEQAEPFFDRGASAGRPDGAWQEDASGRLAGTGTINAGYLGFVDDMRGRKGVGWAICAGRGNSGNSWGERL